MTQVAIVPGLFSKVGLFAFQGCLISDFYEAIANKTRIKLKYQSARIERKGNFPCGMAIIMLCFLISWVYFPQ